MIIYKLRIDITDSSKNFLYSLLNLGIHKSKIRIILTETI